MKIPRTTLKEKTYDRIFSGVHGGRLIYNACWEDPRADRRMLRLDADSRVVMITSAGCNALDYLLDNPYEIRCVDMNPRQNALLELKRQLFKRGVHEDLFRFFGVGRHEGAADVYAEIRPGLPEYAREFWDRKLYYFTGSQLRPSFYYHGAAGNVAWVVRQYLRTKPALRKQIFALLDSQSLEEQRARYAMIEGAFWGRFMEILIANAFTLSMLGVPRPQLDLIKRQYPGGLIAYIKDKLRHVFTELDIRDNYFWRVYLTGSYTTTCCPNYLKAEYFHELRKKIHRVRCHNGALSGFLADNPGPYTHYVLLDHQDWLAYHDTAGLSEEWRRVLENSVPGTRVLARSAGTRVDFYPEFARRAIRDLTKPDDDRDDRVGTYGSVVLAEAL